MMTESTTALEEEIVENQQKITIQEEQIPHSQHSQHYSIQQQQQQHSIQVPSTPDSFDIQRPKPSPYSICVPGFFSVIAAAMVLGIQQQWLILFLCSRFVHPDGSVNPKLSREYLPGLFQTYDILQTEPDFAQCRKIDQIQIAAAHWTLTFAICAGIPSLMTGPIFGVLSDKLGRKPFLLLGMFSGFVFYFAYTLISLLPIGMWILVLCALSVGMMGSYVILLTNTLAYFSDLTDASNRGQVFIIGEASFFAGLSVGPLIGGYIARTFSHGTTKVFMISLAMQVVVLIGSWLWLPESLQEKREPSSPLAQSIHFQSPLAAIKKTIRDVLQVFKKSSSSSFWCLVVVYMLIVPMGGSRRSVFFYFVSYKFGWDSQDEGQYILVASLGRMFHMLLLYPFLTKLAVTADGPPGEKVGFELSVARIGAFLATLGYFAQGFVTHSWMLYVITIFEGFVTLAAPIIQSTLSSSVPTSSQGLLFSGVNVIAEVLGLMCGTLMPLVWSNTLAYMPNAFLIIISVFYGLAFLILVFEISVDDILQSRERVQQWDTHPNEEQVGLLSQVE